MERTRIQLADGVYLTYLPARKFKTSLLSAQFLMPVLHLIPSLFLPVRIPRAGKFTPRRGFYFS